MNHRERTNTNLPAIIVLLLVASAVYVGSYVAVVRWTKMSFASPDANDQSLLRLAAIVYRPAYEVDRQYRDKYWHDRNTKAKFKIDLEKLKDDLADHQRVRRYAGGGLRSKISNPKPKQSDDDAQGSFIEP